MVKKQYIYDSGSLVLKPLLKSINGDVQIFQSISGTLSSPPSIVQQNHNLIRYFDYYRTSATDQVIVSNLSH